MPQPNTEHTLATFTSTELAIVLSYVYTPYISTTIATMGTTDIMGQGEWQLYTYSVAKKFVLHVTNSKKRDK